MPILSGSLFRQSAAAPRFRGNIFGQQKELHDGPALECVDDRAGGRFNLGRYLPDLDSGDSIDFLPQRVGGTFEEVPVKLLYLGGAFWTPGQYQFRRRQGAVQ